MAAAGDGPGTARQLAAVPHSTGAAAPSTGQTWQMDDDALDAFAAWERAAGEIRATPYAASLGDLTRGAARALVEAAEAWQDRRVLDVGTGPGFVALVAQAAGAQVVAVDQSPAMVKIARSHGLLAQQASVESLPFPDGAFDAVLGGFVLNHLARPEAAVAELTRVLRPGGRLALSVWDRPEANPALGLFGPLVRAAGLGATAVPPGPDPARYADADAMTALLSALREVRVERPMWVVDVEPGAWFDAVATSTPRTGAALAAASAQDRSALRARYVRTTLTSYGNGDGRVTLPAQAVVGSGSRP